jgi:hypothetical protein
MAHASRDSRPFARRLEMDVLTPLTQSLNVDPGNARIYLKLAEWWGVDWEWTTAKESGARAVRILNERARKLDPLGAEPILTLLDLREHFARFSEGRAELAHRLAERATDAAEKDRYLEDEKEFRANVQENCQLAANTLAEYLPNDPTDAPLRFRLAALLVRAGKPDEARPQAREALRLDKLSTMPPRRLTDRQREQARGWADVQPDD